MIKLENVRKAFGSKTAVHDISFAARQGVATALLGPNGAGKTTCLRMLTGLVTPDAGKVSIGNIDVLESPIAARAKLGVLSDNGGLYNRLTGFENIAYFGKLRGLSRSTISNNIEQLADILDMGELLNRKTQGFSQGERMKIALARAVVHRPPYVILDEPTNGLDVHTTRAARALLIELKKQGVCLLFSSHLMHEVELICDEITIIAGGKVAVHGSLNDVLQQTQTTDLESAFAKVTARKALSQPEPNL